MTSIKETVERLREEAVNAHKQPSWVDPYFMDDTAALIERLARALEPFAKHADRVATLGVTETDPLPAWLKDCQAARRALKQEG